MLAGTIHRALPKRLKYVVVNGGNEWQETLGEKLEREYF
jgi:hypothetical protein